MALSIINDQGIFHLTGDVNATTSKHFEDHFTEIIKKCNEITLNIDKVNYIDKTGLSVFRRLYFNCIVNNNIAFHIIGNGCKEIFQDLKSTKALN